jgi:hypothetical protein
MGSYKTLSIVQAIVIFICAISIIDYGYSLQHLVDQQNLAVNKLLFDSSSDLWNPVVFWGYLAFIVGILQILKALSSKD